MRKEPPISTSSPRETSTLRPAASAESTSSTAAAPLLTDQRRLGAGETREPALDTRSALPAPAGGEVVLERAVAARHRGHGRLRCGCERGSAQIRMQDHAGRVQHPAQLRAEGFAGTAQRVFGKHAGGHGLDRPRPEAFALPGEFNPYAFDQEQARDARPCRFERGVSQQDLDGRQTAQGAQAGRHDPGTLAGRL